MRKATLFVYLAAVLALGACSKSADVQPSDAQQDAVMDGGPDSTQSGLDSQGVRQGEEFGGMDLDARDQLANTIVFLTTTARTSRWTTRRCWRPMPATW